ncbi:uncharacterized protein EKO05_0011247 [Ascochyta rabiei]|uniref:Uncharacterized protein n=1 Tax=Didymella rabiei TaxID=5454 RepID=A0A163E6J6_DIDRA|nr:uncharacterized protein EKO05_0011247 [Ascochyta rabiei]KZM23544.1 hypothetical protein ST47_g5315 [Ascochyta rabiei]UPX21041.1 hypothetical protein EKO05_0011247 [Ascochyta rabiei]
MNQTPLHGGPARSSSGQFSHQDARSPQNARSSQDARSNFAVQPAADVGTVKLKKKVVKIVSAAGPAPSASLPKTPPAAPASSPVMTSLPTSVSSTALGFAQAQRIVTNENERTEATRPAVKPSSRTAATALPPSKIDLPPPSLEDMYARLSGASSTILSRPAKELSPAAPDKSMFSFEDRLDISTAAVQASAPSSDRVDLQRLRDQPREPQSTLLVQQTLPSINWHDSSQDEQEYLRKAAEYIGALPPSIDNIAQSIKTVSNKLHVSYAPARTKLQPVEVEKLCARYVFAVVTYVNNKVNLSPEPIAADFVMRTLHKNNGNFLRLCAVLVEGNYIALDSLEHVAGLCKNILDVLPKAEGPLSAQPNTAGADVSKPNTATTNARPTSAAKVASADPLDGMKAWPSQERREHSAVYRTCVLKGVSGVKSLNELQALVWGGRLESISMPETGSEHALIKFLTPKACQNYLDATENGIEVYGGTKKTIVFVDKQPGPSSINDVIQNCIDGDASRCVRATGADNDWSDVALFNLARGKQQVKRDVDRIKQGKTARGHHFIEFRFGNIYHALNFKRYLMDDEEWEHCSIGYAPDPCELARGVHYKDADEANGGIFA